VILFGFVLNLVYWIVSNADSELEGWNGGPWIEPTIIAAEIGLTLGTLALACGALLQSRAASIQLDNAGRQASREKEQLKTAAAQTKAAAALIKPYLDLQVVEQSNQPTTQDTFILHGNRWYIRLRLRTLGLGTAVEVQVTALDWWIDPAHLDEELAKLSGGGAFKGPIVTPPSPMPRDLVNVSFAMKAGEERDLNLQTQVPPSPEKMTTLLEQAVVLAWAKNVEGEEVAVQRLGLRLQFVFETMGGGAAPQLERRIIWRWLTDDEVAQIPGLPTNRVSWRSGRVPANSATPK